MSAEAFLSQAKTCLAGDKPVGDLVDCVQEHFPDVDVFREADDLIIKGGGRFLIVRRAGPDLFRITESVAVPSTNSVDGGGGREITLDALISEIEALDD
jgi:hypothetical protein